MIRIKAQSRFVHCWLITANGHVNERDIGFREYLITTRSVFVARVRRR